MTPTRVTLPRYRGRARFGFVLTVLGAFWTIVGICLSVFPTEKLTPGTGVFNSMMAIALLLGPGLYLWLTAKSLAAHNERVERLAALAGIEARMSLSDAATTLGVGIPEVRTMLLDAVNAGILRGRIDAEKNLFISDTRENPLGEREVVCGSCGGRSTVVVRANETPLCRYCGAAAAPVAP